MLTVSLGVCLVFLVYLVLWFWVLWFWVLVLPLLSVCLVWFVPGLCLVCAWFMWFCHS